MKLRIGAAALNQTPLDWENNRANILEAFHEAREKGVELLCLQELAITSYGCQDMFIAEWVSEKAMQIAWELVKETKDLAVCLGIPYRFEGSLYNCMIFASNGEVLGISAKQKLPGDGVYYEPRWFAEWPSGRQESVDLFGKNVPFGDIVYDFKGIRVGFEICEDAWRTDRPACTFIERRVDLVLNPSASHYEFGKWKFREKLMRDSSKQFKCAYVYANQLGNEAGRLIYEGDLMVAKNGQIVERAPLFGFSKLKFINCDLDFSSESQGKSGDESLSAMEEFTGAASLALFDYLRKTRSAGYTISLSGGADSGACAVLVKEMISRAVKALGKEEFCHRIYRDDLLDSSMEEIIASLLTCVYQGTENSSDTTRNAAKSLADELGADYHSWDIDDEIKLATGKIESAIGRQLAWEQDDLTLQNIQSRMRSPLVWMLANARGHLLITTSNRSEGDVGYTTMDGDSSGGLAPLADLDKVFVRKWLAWAEKELSYQSLVHINEQQPTAELRPLEQKQTDEADLMPYDLLLEIEKLAVWKKLSPRQVFEKLGSETHWNHEILKAYISKFYKAWAVSQWKRERIAPSFHFDHFNIDPKTWLRFPILNSGFQSDIDDLKN